MGHRQRQVATDSLACVSSAPNPTLRRSAIAAAATLAVLSFASSSLAADDARAAGDTSLSRISRPALPYCPPARLIRAHPRLIHRAPRPSQCFASVRTEPTYETHSVRVLITPARRERHVVPAVYGWAERQVLVAPARVDRHVVSATYRSVTETEVVTPATVRVEHIDAVYDTVNEQVVARPAHTEWRRTLVGPGGALPPGARMDATGEMICLVEIPAEYRTVQRRVVREPARTIETPVPAITRTVTRQVVDRPEQVTEVQIPAEYRTERYQRLVTPEHAETTVVDAVYGDRIERRISIPARVERRRVPCGPNRPQAR